MKLKIIFLVIFLMFISNINGLYQKEESVLDVGHAVRIEEVSMSPDYIPPGDIGIIKIKIKNNAKFFVKDLVAKLEFPSQIKPYEDVNVVKISELAPGVSKTIEYRVIVSPNAPEEIYQANLVLDYTSYFGANFVNVGETHQDNNSLGIVVKSDPDLFVDIDTTKIYKGNNIGDVSVKFVNNNLANIKFLTVELKEGEDYKIISSSRKYIGDLDSDDFESVDFRIKVKKNLENLKLRFKMDYKDSLNKEYSNEVETTLKIMTAEELGISKKNNYFYLIVIVILIIISYFIYRILKRRRRHKLTV